MSLDPRTGLPPGHLVTQSHEMRQVAKRLADCAAQLRLANEQLMDLDIKGLMAAFDAPPAHRRLG